MFLWQDTELYYFAQGDTAKYERHLKLEHGVFHNLRWLVENTLLTQLPSLARSKGILLLQNNDGELLEKKAFQFLLFFLQKACLLPSPRNYFPCQRHRSKLSL